MTKLSIVLISKNQEWNISRLIESVLTETETMPGTEIVLVDSASTDRTAEIAASYPIIVLKLCPEQRLTAAAGRHVGFNHTTGQFVLFLDGDMELCHGWLNQALHIMYYQSDAAVLTGKVIDRPKRILDSSQDLLKPLPGCTGEVIHVPYGGGASMYRRSVLEQVGSFNPYLYADEEPGLCLQIRHAGHKILQLNYPIAFHFSDPPKAFSTLSIKRSQNYFLGFGQNLRYFFGSPLLWQYLRERGWALPPALLISLGILALTALLFTGQWGWIAMWVGGIILLTIAITVRKRSLKQALITLYGRLLILEGTIHGLFLRPLDPASYPGKYNIIRESEVGMP